MKDFLREYWLFIVIAVALVAAAFYLIRPAPPGTVRIATGVEGGGYDNFGRLYQEILAEQGVKVELVRSGGSIDNIALLTAEEDGVDVAFVQGGLIDRESHPGLLSLGGVFPEPVWVLHRLGQPMSNFRDLLGARIAVGPVGSGTEALSMRLLVGWGIADEVVISNLGGPEAIEALEAGELDVVITVSAGYLEEIARLMREGTVDLKTFDHYEALIKKNPFLTHVRVPRGGVDLAGQLPEKSLDLVAPVATLAAREDLHPALAELLVDAAVRIHGAATPYSEAGDFPSVHYTELPMFPTAERFYRDGPSFLRRIFPFWAANLIGRTLVVLIPLITLLLPLSKILPGALQWSIRRKIFRYYRKVRDLEIRARMKIGDEETKKESLEQLDEWVLEVGDLKVPLKYADEVYRLRLHIQFVHQLVETDFRLGAAPAPG
ncbi:MAG: TAXI family TRAP transporter solute-binding subunit [Puniceicoccaceae bacterium]